MVHLHMGDLPDAFALLREALGFAESLNDASAILRIKNGIGSVYRLTGDYPSAAEIYHECLQLVEGLDQPHFLGMLNGNLGGVYRHMGEPQRALECYERALEIFERIEAPFERVQTQGAIGQTLSDLGDLKTSESFFRRAVDEAQRLEYPAEVARWSINLASHVCGSGRIEEARVILAGLGSTEFADPHVTALYDQVAGQLYELSGDLEAAATVYHQALSVATTIGSPHLASDAHDALRELARKRNDLEAYIEHSEEYHRLQEELRGKDAAVRLTILEKQREIDDLERRHQRHLDILYSTLPRHVAERVARGEVVNDAHKNAAVLFVDIAGFTTQSSTMDPLATTSLLAQIFERFDEICELYDVTKIKTIGDAYMAVALPDTEQHQGECETRLSLAARDVASSAFSWPSGMPVHFRIGMHCGPVVAGVIGTKRMQYDIWGDTVNVASRMESHGEPGRVHVSEAFANSLTPCLPDSLTLLKRGEVDIKGKGPMTTYWLEGA
jgi:class 3 adenylate cyclase